MDSNTSYKLYNAFINQLTKYIIRIFEKIGIYLYTNTYKDIEEIRNALYSKIPYEIFYECMTRVIISNSDFKSICDIVRKIGILPSYTLLKILKEEKIITLNNRLLLNIPSETFYEIITAINDVRNSIKLKRHLNQYPAHVYSIVNRAIKILIDNGFELKNAVMLGDDDCLSIALGILFKKYEIDLKIYVIDLDSDLLDKLNKIGNKYGISLETVHHDLFDPLPRDLVGRFDIFECDPYYSMKELLTWIKRGKEALKINGLRKGYIMYPYVASKDKRKIVENILNEGFNIIEIIPDFNLYTIQETANYIINIHQKKDKLLNNIILNAIKEEIVKISEELNLFPIAFTSDMLIVKYEGVN